MTDQKLKPCPFCGGEVEENTEQSPVQDFKGPGGFYYSEGDYSPSTWREGYNY